MERLKLWMIALAVPITILAITFPKVFVLCTIMVGCIACALALKELIELIKNSNEEAK